MKIEDLIIAITERDIFEEKGIIKVNIDELSDEELSLLSNNAGKELMIDDNKYITYRDVDFNYFVVEKIKSKQEQIDDLIDTIIDNAIYHYVTNWDIDNSMSRKDWESGKQGTIYGYDGGIIKYISYYDFKGLYSNFKYDLDNASDDVLDFIIKYLTEEKEYTRFSDLDREGYTIDEIEEKLNEE